jgi:hypothetical protein
LENLAFQTRDAYEATQLRASTSKFTYCKFSYEDAVRYVEIVSGDKRRRGEPPAIGSTVCLGVRNGREVDCFRVARSGSPIVRWLTRRLERRRHGFCSRVPAVESLGRSSHRDLGGDACVGVELNPLAARPDVWVGSFDALPDEWSGRFEIAYTNAFDHSYNAEETASCWRRIIRPGGYLILGFPDEQEAESINPVGGVSLDDVLRLFPGELIYYRRHGSAWGYTEYIIRFDRAGGHVR